jgi:hypothetical protein
MCLLSVSLSNAPSFGVSQTLYLCYRLIAIVDKCPQSSLTEETRIQRPFDADRPTAYDCQTALRRLKLLPLPDLTEPL